MHNGPLFLSLHLTVIVEARSQVNRLNSYYKFWNIAWAIYVHFASPNDTTGESRVYRIGIIELIAVVEM